jgi:hypothetical protein
MGISNNKSLSLNAMRKTCQNIGLAKRIKP